MQPKKKLFLFITGLVIIQSLRAQQQALSLQQALELTKQYYGTIRAKQKYYEAAQQSIIQARRDYLPNINFAAQQDYGTINGQNGPLYGFGGFSVSSSGLPLATQNWNAAFGSLYLANVNWDVFTFGRIKEHIRSAEAMAVTQQKDLDQEIFQQQVRVAAAYLNLAAAKSLTHSWEKNLSRADTFNRVIKVRALHQLIAGVDSSQSNAEVSNARITLTKAKDFEQEQANNLARLIGIPPADFIIDSIFTAAIPRSYSIQDSINAHPLLQWYQSRIAAGKQQAHYYERFKYPVVSLVGVFQTRGSGFDNSYAQDQTAFTEKYVEGIKPSRSNYLFGIGISWNLTSIFRTSPLVRNQLLQTEGLQAEYALAAQQLTAQLQLADTKITNALSNYHEVPTELKAASDAYLQKSVLYNNGLTNLLDVTQASYALTKAETDRDITYNNVWQALLLKVAATGDLNLLLTEL